MYSKKLNCGKIFADSATFNTIDVLNGRRAVLQCIRSSKQFGTHPNFNDPAAPCFETGDVIIYDTVLFRDDEFNLINFDSTLGYFVLDAGYTYKLAGSIVSNKNMTVQWYDMTHSLPVGTFSGMIQAGFVVQTYDSVAYITTTEPTTMVYRIRYVNSGNVTEIGYQTEFETAPYCTIEVMK